VVRTALKETPQSGTALNIRERIEGKTYGQRDEQVDAEANSGHAGTKQPEALAEAFAFRGLDATRCPERRDKILEYQEEQGRCYK